MKEIDDYVFFFTEKDPFSNWFLRNMVIKNITFNCMEQYIMYAKGMLFGDHDVAAQILQAPKQAWQKALGRQVKGYDEEIWVARRPRIVVAGLCHKFRQNPDILQILLSTQGKVLVEASKHDRIWGVGLSENDPRILDPKKWLGTNLQGECLMEARDILAAEMTSPNS